MTKRRALVAEDSLLILLALEMFLEQQGVDIVGPASTLAEALALVETAEFEIAILDINLHDVMSFPVAERLLQRGIPVIFTTGYSAREILPPHLQGVPTVQKPYETDALMHAVEKAFTRAGKSLAVD